MLRWLRVRSQRISVRTVAWFLLVLPGRMYGRLLRGQVKTVCMSRTTGVTAFALTFTAHLS